MTQKLGPSRKAQADLQAQVALRVQADLKVSSEPGPPSSPPLDLHPPDPPLRGAPSIHPTHGRRQRTRAFLPPNLADYQASLPAERLSRLEVGALLRRASRRLGVQFVADWGSGSTRIEAHAGVARVSVPGGLLRTKGLSLDGLALILADEAAHVQGAKDECQADDWAVREGLPKLWGRPHAADPRRALYAAYSALHDQIGDEHPLDPTRSPPDVLPVYPTSYAPLQARFAIYQRGILGLPPPTLLRRSEGEPGLIDTTAAAQLLEVSPGVLDNLADRPKAPRSADAPGARVWLQDDLAAFRVKVRNLAQIAIAKEELLPGTTPDERIVRHAVEFAEHWAKDPAFRDLCYRSWPFPEGTGRVLLEHLHDQLP